MKKLNLFLFSLLLNTMAWAQVPSQEANIEAAFSQSFATQQNQLEPLIAELKADATANTYWIAYSQFFSSIYFLNSGKKDKAVVAAADAIALLENKADKNSEEYALLGYLLGYSIAFEPAAAGKLSAKGAGYYREALKKDANNLRAYVGLGVSDFQIPENIGGGKKVEEYMLKALALPEQTFEGGPKWGKNVAYHTLASFYKRAGQTDKAKMYCMQGLAKYPQDFQLNQLKQSL